MASPSGVGQHALECYDLCKHYGRGSSKLNVLQNLAMTVPKGKIYGLLGPSGCGKTTLLRCALGRLSFDEGMILTLGRPPATRGHGVPGSRVGYMPQELALYNEFTINETLVYFATIHHMTRKESRFRIDFLLDLLNLPEKGRMVSNLSGGQKRRVSFAVALIQSPELLILDEPTVGVDPLLRQKIWDYLLRFSQEQHTTIILTTHYIEEARNADMVGLMRHGKILSEDCPQALLDKHQMPTLESIFLKLCMADAKEETEDGVVVRVIQTTVTSTYEQPSASAQYVSNGNQTPPASHKSTTPLLTERSALCGSNAGQPNHKYTSYTNPVFQDKNEGQFQDQYQAQDQGSSLPIAAPTGYHGHDGGGRNRANTKSGIPDYHYDKPPFRIKDFLPSLMSMWALIIKDIIKLGRNPGLTVFYFLVPIVEVSLFYLAIGGVPKNLVVAVINNDIDGGSLPLNLTRFGEAFLHNLDDEIIKQYPVHSLDDAVADMREGKYWGIIEIPTNYSEYTIKRLTATGIVDNETLAGSTITVTLDATNQQISLTIQSSVLAAYDLLIAGLFEKFGVDPAQAQIPIKFNPLYGSMDSSFTEFMAAGVIISVIFFLAVGLTSVTFVVERKEGLMDRIWVAGVGTGEVTIAHVVTQFAVISVQIALVLVFTFIVFHVTNEGSVMLTVLLCMLQGLCGMSIGLLISSVCDTEAGAVQAALGSFYPIMLLSGILWPIQAIPEPLYYLALALPQTFAAESLRAIMFKGWGLDHYVVWIGYVVTTAWWLVPLALSALILQLRR